MGIFDRLSLLIRSNLNDAISRGENPEKVLNQIIIDMREQLARAKQEVAVAIADERRLKAQMEDEHKQAADWEHRAMLALRESREDLAKQALIRHQEHAERAGALQETWQKQSQETEKLKGSLHQLNDKIEEAKRKKNLLVAKQKRAQAQKRIHETMAGLNDKSAFDAFERMAEKIEENERLTLAAAEVTEELAGDNLEKEFALMHGSDTIERRLAALKQQMGLPAGPSRSAAALPSGAPPEKNTTGNRQLKAANGDTDSVQDAQIEEDA